MKKQLIISTIILSALSSFAFADEGFGAFEDLKNIEEQFYESPVTLPQVQTTEEVKTNYNKDKREVFL